MLSSIKFNIRSLVRAAYVLGFPLFMIFVIEMAYYGYTYGENGPGSKLLSDISLAIVFYSMMLVFALITYLIMAYPYEFFKRSEYELRGAYKYKICRSGKDEYVELIDKKVNEDKFVFAGQIENPHDSVIEVYVKRLGLYPETILLIETEVFTEELLLEHMSLLEKFMAEYKGSHNLNWAKKMRTIVIVDRMSLPLQVLLSMKNFYAINLLYVIPFFAATTGEVFAIEREGSNAFVQAKPDNQKSGVRKNWLMEYIISPEEEHEHVWKDVKWEDIINEFPRYRDFPVVVHKAINMWKGGYEE